VPFSGGAGSPSNTMSLGLRSTSLPSGILIYPDVWPKPTWPKIRECDPLGGAGSPPNTMWLEPRPTSRLSFILVRSTVWPQYTNITDKQDNGLMA